MSACDNGTCKCCPRCGCRHTCTCNRNLGFEDGASDMSSCAAKVDGTNKEVFSFFFFFAGVRGETGNTRAAAAAAKDLVGNCNGFFSKASGAGAKDLFGNSIGLVSSET
ncbi:unnamed protein product [Sphagnum troendelagicum]|uniref:Metallothionein-like protein n=1 Tax=Sphagnum troendelagicum TaxID=128251 RepID=A0ABP0UIL4_9BRYO